MNEYNIRVLLFGILLFMFVLLIGVVGYLHKQELNHEIQLAKSGLQQCSDGLRILWKKECK